MEIEPASLVLLSVGLSMDVLSVAATTGFGMGRMTGRQMTRLATSFAFTYLGVALGSRTGGRLGRWAQVIGGLILIGIGLRVFLSHVM